MPERPTAALNTNDRERLEMIVRTHNPDDWCQNVVRETALAVLRGEREISPYGLLYLTNGARGYDPDKIITQYRTLPLPDNADDHTERQSDT